MRKGISVLILLICCLLCVSAGADLRKVEIPAGAAEVDLSVIKKLQDKEVDALAAMLNDAKDLVACDMSAVQVSLSAAVKLTEACPQIRFHFNVSLYGQKVDNQVTDLNLDDLKREKKITVDDIRALIALDPDLQAVTMYNSPFELDVMRGLLAEYPQIEFRWTVRYNGMSLRPGATAYSTLKGRQDPRYTADDIAPILKEFCPDLLALDVGHNDVSDLTFLESWPNLRRLIVIDSKTPVTDISPLAELDDLEYVELFMQNITDISPLAGKTRLLDLNLCHNDITDLTPLYSCVNLERLWISFNRHLSEEEIAAFKAAVPGCKVETKEYQSTGAGWRVHNRYDIMYNSFVTGIYEPFSEEQE